MSASGPADPPGTEAAPQNAASPNTIARNQRSTVRNWLVAPVTSVPLQDGNCMAIRMDDFLDITNPADWFHGEVLSAALELERARLHRDDILVVGDSNAQTLYSVSMRRTTVEDFLQDYSELSDLLSTRRWIVVPCSDGISTNYEIAQEFESAEKEKDAFGETELPAEAETGTNPGANGKPKPKPKSESKSKSKSKSKSAPKPKGNGKGKSKANGNHWGLLVIDKENKVARFVDSAINLRTRNGKESIYQMSRAGEVAGRILDALEMVLISQDDTFTTGCFEASTLKYTPQQAVHNDFDFDEGACGPFAFAFFEHILNQPAQMHDLKAMFPRRKRDMTTFDSWETRHSIQTLIDKKIAELNADNPYNLSHQVLQALRFTPGTLTHVVYGSLGMSTNPPRSNIPKQLSEDQRLLMKEYKKHRKQNPGDYKDYNKKERREYFKTIQMSTENIIGSDGGIIEFPDVDTDDVMPDEEEVDDRPADGEKNNSRRSSGNGVGGPPGNGPSGSNNPLGGDDNSSNGGAPRNSIVLPQGGQRSLGELLKDNEFHHQRLELRKKPVSFLSMPESKVDLWVDKKPFGKLLTHKDDLWYKKAALQKGNGGFSPLLANGGKKAISWRDEDPFFKDKTISAKQVAKELEERVAGIPATRLPHDSYPQYYSDALDTKAADMVTSEISKRNTQNVGSRTGNPQIPTHNNTNAVPQNSELRSIRTGEGTDGNSSNNPPKNTNQSRKRDRTHDETDADDEQNVRQSKRQKASNQGEQAAALPQNSLDHGNAPAVVQGSTNTTQPQGEKRKRNEPVVVVEVEEQEEQGGGQRNRKPKRQRTGKKSKTTENTTKASKLNQESQQTSREASQQPDLRRSSRQASQTSQASQASQRPSGAASRQTSRAPSRQTSRAPSQQTNGEGSQLSGQGSQQKGRKRPQPKQNQDLNPVKTRSGRESKPPPKFE